MSEHGSIVLQSRNQHCQGTVDRATLSVLPLLLLECLSILILILAVGMVAVCVVAQVGFRLRILLLATLSNLPPFPFASLSLFVGTVFVVEAPIMLEWVTVPAFRKSSRVEPLPRVLGLRFGVAALALS